MTIHSRLEWSMKKNLMTTKPDCCAVPELLTIRVLSEAPDGEIDLRQCAGCQSYWNVMVHERPKMNGESDQLWEWFQLLTKDQAEGLLGRRVG